MKAYISAAALAAGLFAACAASAAPGDSAIGVNLGSTGFGLEYQRAVNDHLVVRGAADYFSYSHGDTLDDINYDGKLKFTTGGLFADWHPTGGSFFVSGGAFFGTRKFEIDATPTSNVTIGSTTYTPAQIGRLSGEADLGGVAPFLGIGFDNSVSRTSSWGLKTLIGIGFSGSPEIKLNCSGPACSSAGVQNDLAAEARTTEEDLDGFKYYPVFQIGLTRRF